MKEAISGILAIIAVCAAIAWAGYEEHNYTLENCEVVKSCRRHVDTANPDILGAIADCYQDTACAIMAPNQLRFQILEQLIDEYQVEGILDLSLQTCHAYTVERDKMRRFCQQKAIPYLPVETGFTDADCGQIETRVSAFIEML